MEFMILIHGDESSPRLAPGDPVHPRHLARACMWAEKMFPLYS